MGTSSSNPEGAVPQKDDLSAKFSDESLEEPPNTSSHVYKPNVAWDDIIEMDSAKSALQTDVLLPMRFPCLFHGNRNARAFRSCLLYGPAGIGKTRLAEAVANKAEKSLFRLNMAVVMSSPENPAESMRSLFQLARDQKPSIILLDRIDAIYLKEDGTPVRSDPLKEIKVELMVQMDGFVYDCEGIVVLATTDRPWLLEGSVRKRFHRRIYVPLPNQREREELFKLYLADIPMFVDKQLLCEDLASKTGGYSGSEIGTIVRNVLAGWVSDYQINDTAKLFEDMHRTVSKTTPSVKEEEAQKFIEWTREFGSN